MIRRWLNLAVTAVAIIMVTACGKFRSDAHERETSNAAPHLLELGRQLFSEPKLSYSGKMSCQSCHNPRFAFTDRRSLPRGVTGQELPRNSPPVLYAGIFTKLTWVNPVLDSLETQILVPLYGENPPEQHVGPREEVIFRDIFAGDARARLKTEAEAELGSGAGTRTLVVKALATYVRSLSPFASAYDRYLAGDGGALSVRQKEGLQLFEGKGNCVSCHSGPLLNGQELARESQTWTPNIFRRNGLNAERRKPDQALGLAEFTLNPDDWNMFRVPSLRNVADTAPYLHDGSRPELSLLLSEYNAARNLGLDAAELEALEDFLKSLSDAAPS